MASKYRNNIDVLEKEYENKINRQERILYTMYDFIGCMNEFTFAEFRQIFPKYSKNILDDMVSKGILEKNNEKYYIGIHGAIYMGEEPDSLHINEEEDEIMDEIMDVEVELEDDEKEDEKNV